MKGIKFTLDFKHCFLYLKTLKLTFLIKKTLLPQVLCYQNLQMFLSVKETCINVIMHIQYPYYFPRAIKVHLITIKPLWDQVMWSTLNFTDVAVGLQGII